MIAQITLTLLIGYVVAGVLMAWMLVIASEQTDAEGVRLLQHAEILRRQLRDPVPLYVSLFLICLLRWPVILVRVINRL